MSKVSIQTLTENLIKLQRKYAFTYRKIVPEERYTGLVKSGILKQFDFNTEAILEPLIEHVGHLPIIATYLHQHIEHRTEVDLGRALIMVAIHDIGETEVGDMLTYAKTKSHEISEIKAAKKLLPGYLWPYYEECETQNTLDGKFAKSVDSIAPMLHELGLPEIQMERFKFHKFNTDMIIARKQQHFEWDGVMKEIFDYLIGKYRALETQRLR